MSHRYAVHKYGILEAFVFYSCLQKLMLMKKMQCSNIYYSGKVMALPE